VRVEATARDGPTAVKQACVVLAVALALSACAPPREGAPGAAPAATSGATDAQRPLAEPGPPPVAGLSPAAPTAPVAPAAPSDAAPIVVPADVLYLCVSESGGARRDTPIEFPPNVGELCRKHPEMGPCQYERDVCRRSGGRVFAAGGKEITAQTEAEYDRKVMRVRLKSN
jgi:hypothetical protein